MRNEEKAPEDAGANQERDEGTLDGSSYNLGGSDGQPLDPGDVAVAFLERLRPGGPWLLTAIVPDGKTATETCHTADDVRAFVAAHNGKRNLYYHLNPTRGSMTKKASKVDLAAIEFIHADLDPRKDETPADAKARYQAALATEGLTPTGMIDSGNGLQALLRLREAIPLPPPVETVDAEGKRKLVLSPEGEALIASIESRGKGLLARLGGDQGTANIDRILRLPGTTNLPNAKKVKAGRVPCETAMLDFNDRTFALDDFAPMEAHEGPHHGGPCRQSRGGRWRRL